MDRIKLLCKYANMGKANLEKEYVYWVKSNQHWEQMEAKARDDNNHNLLQIIKDTSLNNQNIIEIIEELIYS